MQHQQQTNWCWAAASVSVNLYFDSKSTWQQCTVANNGLGQSSCCNNGDANECNQPWYLDRALTIVGNLDSVEQRRGTMDEVSAALDASSPLCLRIGWNDGGGHFVAIYGYSGTTLNIGDPWFDDAIVNYNSFPENYQDRGAWTDTFWVKA
jgi:hypothetical protein